MSADIAVKQNLSEEHLRQLMSWFASQTEVSRWGGLEFRFPFTNASFVDDVKFNELMSLGLVNQVDQLLAFGQSYERLGKCHFARLAVAPKQRGKKLVNRLMAALAEVAKADF